MLAGTEVEVKGLEGASIDGGSILVQDQWYSYMYNTPGYTNRFCLLDKKVGVKFWIDRDMLGAYSSSWELDVSYDISLKKEDGTTLNLTSETLEIAFDPVAGATYNDIVLKEYTGYLWANITNIQITAAGIADAPAGVHFDGIVTVERFYDLDASEVPIMKRQELSSTHELDLRWNYIEGAESYDLEWVFVDLPDELFSGAHAFSFKNATRINVPTNHYDLSMAFPRGIVVFRVRGRGYDCSGNLILGTWSYDPTPGTTTDEIPSLGLGAVPPKWEWDGIELDKNWQYQVAYSEDGKRKEAISFFDGSLRNRQSITVLNTDDHAIAGQSIYDYLGRPALQVLPAPMINEGIRFYDSLSMSDTNVYHYRNFDLNTNVNAPQLIDTTDSKGAGYYYSGANSSPFGHLGDYTPTANGKPFTRVRYMNDGTGRIRKQSGVGNTLGVGGDHEVEYFYGAPSGQAELDRLFGSEVGFVQQYKKNMVIDPNGQTSVSYVDQNGRTIATALAGDAPTNLEEIDTRPDDFDTITSDLTDFNILSQDGRCITVSNTFLVSATGYYDFEYGLDSTEHPACYGDVDCVYDITFGLQDESGNFLTDTAGNQSGNTFSDKEFVAQNSRVFNLTPGAYTVTKKLCITDEQLDSVYQDFYDNAPLDAACGLTRPDSISGTPCNPSCQEICDSTYIRYNFDGNYEYMNAAQDVQCVVTDYNSSSYPADWTYASGNSSDSSLARVVLDLIDQCMLDCTDDTSGYIPSECEIRAEIMEIDMTPGGQYFDNAPFEDSTSYDENEWLEDNLGTNPSSLSGSPWPSSYTTWDEVRDNWDDAWANFMAEQHPERCIYDHFCPGECRSGDDPDNYYTYLFTEAPLDPAPNDTTQWVFNPLKISPQRDSTNTPGTYQPYSNYTDVLSTDYPDAPAAGSGNGFADPWFTSGACHADLKDTLISYLECYLVDPNDSTKKYSLWYVMNDPDTIARGGTHSYSGSVDTNIVDIFENLHGDGGSITGLIGSGTDQISEFEFFRSAYNFYRNLVLYEDYVNNVCDSSTCLDTNGCWLAHDGYGFTADGFQVRYQQNQVFEAFLNGDPQDYAENEQDTTCWDQCAQKAEYWSQQLADGGCIDSSDINIVDSLFYEVCLIACDSLGFPSSLGDSGTVAVVYGGQNFYTYTDVADYYATQCTGCAGSCDSILFPAPEFDQEVCACGKIIDFVEGYFEQDSIIGGDVYDPLTEIINAGGDTADFHADLDELLSDDESAANFNLELLENWLADCETGSAFSDTLMEAFKCDTVPDTGDTISIAGFIEDCGEALDALANYNLFMAYEQQLDSAATAFLEDYKYTCLDGIEHREHFTMTYVLSEYHYTLYFYDQADNLIKTVPPSGVFQKDPAGSTVLHSSFLAGAELDTTDWFRKDTTDGKYLHPDHVMITNYKYNSLQKLIEQTTPDGGTSHFWYDALDRIVLSRNAKQLGDSTFSYTLYDELGRVVESGEVKKSTNTYTYEQLVDTARTTDIFTSPTDNTLYNFINGGEKTEVSCTYYDAPLSTTTDGYFDNGQQFLRTRIATVTYEEVDDGDSLTYNTASHYTYDIHGNVDVLIQENSDLEDLDQHLKTMTYEYDLISGNVNQVNYQAGKYDEFYHRYCYDADNRITEVFTSRDGSLWERDEKQLYYAHGPLARKEIGDMQVQACDHVYNAQGWLKTINSSTGNEDHDAGADSKSGTRNQNFGQDALGFSLHYFDNDYTAIGSGANANLTASLTNTSLLAETNELYNGNIMAMVTGIKDQNESHIDVHANVYKYDQLNRIKESNVYQHNTGTDPYENALFGSTNTSNDSSYHTQYTFDGNGNIHGLKRFDNSSTPVLMDHFEYYFQDTAAHAAKRKVNNKLDYVRDLAGAAVYNDISNTQGVENYIYDSIGQLIKDVDENIDSIAWDVRNKVLRIVRTGSNDQPDVEFHYDAMGQRISKIEIPRINGVIQDQKDWEYTYYVRDAQGNPMGVYKRIFEHISGNDYADTLKLLEHHIYGSDRSGLSTYSDRKVTGNFTATGTTTDAYGATIFDTSLVTYTSVTTDTAAHRLDSICYLYDRGIGNKNYELKNHLGNVLSVITDQRLGVDDVAGGDFEYFTADVVSYSDYYPYGMLQPGRHQSSANYRYGFNGMERDDEVKGGGNHLDFGARCYDNRVGRWFSQDPIIKEHLSPYNFSSNDPIARVDVDGRDDFYYWYNYVRRNGKIVSYEFVWHRVKNDNATRLIHREFKDHYAEEGDPLYAGNGRQYDIGITEIVETEKDFSDGYTIFLIASHADLAYDIRKDLRSHGMHKAAYDIVQQQGVSIVNRAHQNFRDDPRGGLFLLFVEMGMGGGALSGALSTLKSGGSAINLLTRTSRFTSMSRYGMATVRTGKSTLDGFKLSESAGNGIRIFNKPGSVSRAVGSGRWASTKDLVTEGIRYTTSRGATQGISKTFQLMRPDPRLTISLFAGSSSVMQTVGTGIAVTSLGGVGLSYAAFQVSGNKADDGLDRQREMLNGGEVTIELKPLHEY